MDKKDKVFDLAALRRLIVSGYVDCARNAGLNLTEDEIYQNFVAPYVTLADAVEEAENDAHTPGV